MTKSRKIALKAAFTYTLPILTGLLFLGLAYGVMMTALGFAPWMPVLMAALICAGSMEFVTVSMLLGPFNPLGAVLMTLMVNGRHLFYGLSLLRPYQRAGKKRIYMIFALVDETYSLLVSVRPPEGADESWFRFYVTLFIQSYWVLGTALGAFAGSWIHFDTTGIAFVMTALFVVLFMEKWRSGRGEGLTAGRRAGLIGLLVSSLSLILFGAEHFMIPAMIAVLLALLGFRSWIEKGVGV